MDMNTEDDPFFIFSFRSFRCSDTFGGYILLGAVVVLDETDANAVAMRRTQAKLALLSSIRLGFLLARERVSYSISGHSLQVLPRGGLVVGRGAGAGDFILFIFTTGRSPC